MYDVMVDCETLGVNEGAPVISASMVLFDRTKEQSVTELFNNPHITVMFPLMPQFAHGCYIEPETAKWWNKQKASVLKHQMLGDLKRPLRDINEWIAQQRANLVDRNSEQGTANMLEFWANAPSFDMKILGSLFKLEELKLDIDFRSERCVRTIKQWYHVDINYKGLVPPLQPHDPHHDCVGQIMLVQKAYCSDN